MAKKFRVLRGLLKDLEGLVNQLGLKEDKFNLGFNCHGADKYVLTFFNEAPIIVDLDLTTDFIVGDQAPDWNTYITYSDADGTNTTLEINTSEVDMLTVGTFNVTWTVTDEWQDSTELVKEITISAE